jgi:hypothetical protein
VKKQMISCLMMVSGFGPGFESGGIALEMPVVTNSKTIIRHEIICFFTFLFLSRRTRPFSRMRRRVVGGQNPVRFNRSICEILNASALGSGDCVTPPFK